MKTSIEIKINSKTDLVIDLKAWMLGFATQRESDGNLFIVISFLFMTITIYRPYKPKKEIIKAKIEGFSTVSFPENQHITHMPYKYYLNPERLRVIWVKDLNGKMLRCTDFSYVEKMDRYICRFKERSRIIIFRPENVWLFPLDLEVEGYVKNGRFVVVD